MRNQILSYMSSQFALGYLPNRFLCTIWVADDSWLFVLSDRVYWYWVCAALLPNQSAWKLHRVTIDSMVLQKYIWGKLILQVSQFYWLMKTVCLVWVAFHRNVSGMSPQFLNIYLHCKLQISSRYWIPEQTAIHQILNSEQIAIPQQHVPWLKAYYAMIAGTLNQLNFFPQPSFSTSQH